MKREGTFCHSLSFYGFDIFLTALCQISVKLAFWHELQLKNKRTWVLFFDELWISCSTTNFCCRNLHVIVPRAAVWSYIIASYLGSQRIFKIFNSKWSYDKMLIDWLRSGLTGKYLARGQDVQTSLRSVRTPWARAKYFPVQPSHSVNKYIVFCCN